MRTFSPDWKYCIEITDEQIEYARWFAQNAGTYRRQSGFNGNESRQLVGALGQLILTDGFGLPRPDPNEKGHDGGIDALIGGKKVDVKSFNTKQPCSMFYGRTPGTTFLDAEQFEKDDILKTEVYLFCAVDVENKKAEFVGWLRKGDMRPWWYYAKGSEIPRKGTPLIAQRNNYLIPFCEMEQFHPLTFKGRMELFA